ncbi:hypothetical protein RvY_05847 [Ramazzottius varieornatus]|uniref:FRA10AC1 n=1 Tax=Ramazzottius varieornatus TaxID=947166 RepID=A0A1D1V650_RAMVA|nr:hypothetical protein RvY_05847 [Ramazzottius varieornatus]
MAEYSSEFEYDSEAETKRKRRHDLTQKTVPRPDPSQQTGNKRPRLSDPTDFREAIDRDRREIYGFHLSGLDAFTRHKKLVNEYLLTTTGSTKLLARDTSRDRTDLDVIRQNHRFVWEDEEDQTGTWEQQLAKKYYNKLFKEYCIADLGGYKQKKIGMRWRTEKEVIEGKGQFICGSKKCDKKDNLKSWEVNFGYMEKDIKKNALVKLRLCPECSGKLNYTGRHKESKRSLVVKLEPESSRASVSALTTSSREELNPDPSAAASAEEVREEEKVIWGKPAVPVVEERTRVKDFDDYFADMLL